MFKLIALALLVILIPSLLLVGLVKTINSSSDDVSPSDHRASYNDLSTAGSLECKDRGMKYITVSEPYSEVFNTYCYTESPFKIYTFEVSN